MSGVTNREFRALIRENRALQQTVIELERAAGDQNRRVAALASDLINLQDTLNQGHRFLDRSLQDAARIQRNMHLFAIGIAVAILAFGFGFIYSLIKNLQDS